MASKPMTDPMELVGRLEAYRPTNEWGDPVHHAIADEAAACIREMVETQVALGARLDRAMTIIGSHYAAKAGLNETLPLPLKHQEQKHDR